jgi:hypothetical protein
MQNAKRRIFIREIREIPVHRSLGEGGRGSIPLVAPGCAGLQNVRIAPFREDFTTDGTDGTDKSRLVQDHFQSVKSVKSVVRCLWLRLTSAGLLAPKAFGVDSLFAAISSYSILRTAL